MSKPRAIFELLANQFSGEFEQTIQRGRTLRLLWDRLQSMLDPDLAAHCQLLNLRSGIAIIACDATAWATRLRFQIPTLLEALRQLSGLEELRDIQIRLQPVTQAPLQQPKSRATLSSHGAYCLRQCANSVTDPDLRRALERLAERQGKSES